MNGTFYVFANGELTLTEARETSPQVADSFLVSEGRVRSLDKHIERFNSSAQKLTQENLEVFWQAVVATIPRTDEWFPRVELADGDLLLRLRPKQEFQPTVVLWSADPGDERVDPTTKGPDLAFGASLRRKSNLHGADEAVIIDTAGYVVEGALSSLVWWRDGILYGPDHQTRWLPSVTRLEVFELATQAGYETGTEHVRPEDLIGLELWIMSSFTGIRPVVDWVNLPGEVGPQQHLESFQRRLKLMSRDLDEFLVN